MSRTKLLVAALALCLYDSQTLCGTEQPHVVLVVGTHHYEPHLTLPVFAKELERLGCRTSLVIGDGDPEKKVQNVLPGIEALAEADVAILHLRFLQLPDREWKIVEDYIKSGKPIIALRTTNHAFNYPKGHPRYAWNDGFGQRVLGTPYVVHQKGETDITTVAKYRSHPILTGIKTDWVSPGSLYLTRLQSGCTPLIIGTGKGRMRLVEKAFGPIQVNETESDIVAWVWENEWGARVFSTSLGHIGDYAEESFTRMLVNSVYWAVDRPVPSADEEIATWSIPRPPRKSSGHNPKPKR